MKVDFDIEKFVEKSRALDLSGIDWEAARREPVSEAEIRCLTYMIDVEIYTIAYLRDLLNTSAIKDRQIADFLPCWAYEESFHGRALERFLNEIGRPLDPNRERSYQKKEHWWESFKDFGATIISKFSSDFLAVYLSWGAIQELTTLNGYNTLARRTRNSALAEIARRIKIDESRHFGFYYNKALERLSSSANARWITSFMVKTFWIPVGAGIMNDKEVDFITAYTFGGSEGQEAAKNVDNTIARLPGLDWFNRVSKFAEQSCHRLLSQAPWQDSEGAGKNLKG